MAMTGTVTGINMDGIVIRTAKREERYRFDVPYTSKAGKFMGQGASFAVIDNNGDYKIRVGDNVEFSYEDGPEGLFLKFIKVTQSGGAPAQTGYTPNKPLNQPASAPAPAYSGGDNKTQEIYYQHAQKIATEFLCAHPEIVNNLYDEKAGSLDKDLIYVENVQKIADLLTQGFCIRYGLTYVNKSQGQ